MVWQDVILALGSVFFIIAMVPTLISKVEKPPRSSCLITALWLWAFQSVYISYGLWATSMVGVLSAVGWTILFFQRRIISGV